MKSRVIRFVTATLAAATSVTLLAGCSSSDDAERSAEAAAPAARVGMPLDNLPSVAIGTDANGATVELFPNQIGCIEEIFEEVTLVTNVDTDVVSVADEATDGTGATCGPAVIGGELGTADVEVLDVSGNAIRAFTVNVIEWQEG